jgi:mRNA-degrading endonuclease RelE of RelBE toxin-antitoxin system
MDVILTGQFEHSYRRLSAEDREKVRKSILELEENPHAPGLRVKKMADRGSIWEARASRKLRFTFEMSGESFILRHVGEHDRVLDNP